MSKKPYKNGRPAHRPYGFNAKTGHHCTIPNCTGEDQKTNKVFELVVFPHDKLKTLQWISIIKSVFPDYSIPLENGILESKFRQFNGVCSRHFLTEEETGVRKREVRAFDQCRLVIKTGPNKQLLMQFKEKYCKDKKLKPKIKSCNSSVLSDFSFTSRTSGKCSFMKPLNSSTPKKNVQKESKITKPLHKNVVFPKVVTPGVKRKKFINDLLKDHRNIELKDKKAKLADSGFEKSTAVEVDLDFSDNDSIKSESSDTLKIFTDNEPKFKIESINELFYSM